MLHILYPIYYYVTINGLVHKFTYVSLFKKQHKYIIIKGNLYMHDINLCLASNVVSGI